MTAQMTAPEHLARLAFRQPAHGGRAPVHPRARGPAAGAVRGLDPMTGRPAGPDMPPWPGGAFLWWFFGAAVALHRMTEGLTDRAAAKAAGVSSATWCRAEHSEAVGVLSILRLSAVLGRHPHCFTGNINCNALKSQDTGAQTGAQTGAEARAA